MEHYLVIIDHRIRTKQDLFARFTDAIFLGFSGIENWDAFIDFMDDNLDEKELLVTVCHDDLSGINPKDRAIYLDVLADLTSIWPEKIYVLDRGG